MSAKFGLISAVLGVIERKIYKSPVKFFKRNFSAEAHGASGTKWLRRKKLPRKKQKRAARRDDVSLFAKHPDFGPGVLILSKEKAPNELGRFLWRSLRDFHSPLMRLFRGSAKMFSGHFVDVRYALMC